MGQKVNCCTQSSRVNPDNEFLCCGNVCGDDNDRDPDNLNFNLHHRPAQLPSYVSPDMRSLASP